MIDFYEVNDKMVTCVYDNPSTMCRECWVDKKLICSYNFRLFYLAKGFDYGKMFFGANIGDWKEGQLIGDKEAMI